MTRNYSQLCIAGFLCSFLISTDAFVAILGGELPVANRFQYQVSLHVNGKHICGGGIIDDKHILTAAHCVIQRNNLFKDNFITVHAGTHNKNIKGVTGEVKKVFALKSYRPLPANTGGDIAILQLKDSLGLWRHRQLTKLELPTIKHETYAGKTAVIAGFGANSIEVHNNEESNGKSDGKLRFAEADIITTSVCQEGYDKLKILPKHICARVKQKNVPRGVCTGDSGGPLVHEGKLAIGILSISPIGCEEITSAGIYTRISDYLDFIDNVTKNKESNDTRSINLIP